MSKILQFFCYDSFEDLLAPVIFAKNVGFLADIVFKIIAIKNAFATNHNINQYCCNIHVTEIITMKKSIFA